MDQTSTWAPLLGIIGVVVGSLVTGGIQLGLARINAKRQRAEARRDERVKIYLEALWHLSSAASGEHVHDFEQAERAAHARGEEFRGLETSRLEDLDRALFELRLLGRSEVASEVWKYMSEFGEWLSAPVENKQERDYDALPESLRQREERIRAMMRADLDVD